MNKLKKHLAILLSVAMIIGLMPSVAFAAEGGITTDDSGFLIMGGMLFSYSGDAETVEIPDTVTNILGDAFKGNSKITKVIIPSSVMMLGASAFDGCAALAEVEFEDGSGLTTIPSRAFASCPRLRLVNIPDSVTTIESGAFASCGAYLKSIDIPAGVSKLGETGIDVFDGSQVADVNLDENNAVYESYDGVVYTKEDHTAYFCVPGKTGTVEIKEGTLSIGNKAFYKSKVDNVVIPEGVTQIGAQAFASSQVITANVPSSVTAIGRSAFNNTKLRTIDIADGVKTIGESAFESCYYLHSLHFPASVTELEDDVASDNSTPFKVMRVDNPDAVLGSSLLDATYYGITVVGKAGSTAETYVNGVREKYEGSDGLLQFLPLEDYTEVEAVSLSETKQTLYLEETLRLTAELTPAEPTFDDITWYSTNTEVATVTDKGLVEAVSVGEAEIHAVSVDGPSAVCRVTVSKDPDKSDYKINEDGMITGYIGTDTDLDIPDTVNGIVVKGIAENAFKGTNVESVVIPAAAKTIGSSAFENCSSLLSVSLAEGVEDIGEKAFGNCENLHSIVLPASVTKLGESAFAECKKMQTAEVKASVAELPANLFASCSALTSVTLPDTLQTIGESCFASSGLENIDLPTSLKTIQEKAFSACTSLKRIELPEGLETVGALAFHNDTGLTEMVISSTVTNLGGTYVRDLFENRETDNSAANLGTITVADENAVYRSIDNMIYTKDGSTLLFCPRNREEAVIADGTTKIGDYACFICEELASVTFPDSLVEIGEHAFQYDASLTELVFPEGLTTIGHAAFDSAEGIQKVELPSTLTTLDGYAFCEVEDLESVVIPDGVTRIEDYTFWGATLKELVLPNGLTYIGNDAFAWIRAEHLYIPASVTYIGNEAFGRADNLTYVTLPESITSLGRKVLLCSAATAEKQSKLEAVFVPSGCTKIDDEWDDVAISGDWYSTKRSPYLFSDEATDFLTDFAKRTKMTFGIFTTDKPDSIDVIVEDVQHLLDGTEESPVLSAEITDLAAETDAVEALTADYPNSKAGYLFRLAMTKQEEAYDGDALITLSIGVPEELADQEDLILLQSVDGTVSKLDYTRIGDRIFAEAAPQGDYGLIAPETEKPSKPSSGGKSSGGNTTPVTPTPTPEPTPEVNYPSKAFTDLDLNAWYREGTDFVIEKGLMNGVGEKTFAPNATTTRAMIVTILYRMEGSPKAGASAFTDLTDDWYQDAVNWAAEQGIVNGTSETTFAPNDTITREQMAAILARYAAVKGVNTSQKADLSKYSDEDAVSGYAEDSMAWAVNVGLVNGVTATTLDPKGSATRAQAAVLFQRMCETILK